MFDNMSNLSDVTQTIGRYCYSLMFKIYFGIPFL